MTKLNDAWTIRPSYDVALSLSQAEFNLGQFDESAGHLAYYFKNVSAKENENNLANAKQAFEAAKAKVSSVQVTAPRGATILVDGKDVGPAPLDGGTFVKPGKRVFEARLGDAKAVQELQAVAGQEQQVTLKPEQPAPPASLAASPAAAVDAGLPEAPPAPAPPGDHTDSAPSMVPLIVGGIIVVIGAGLGIGYRIAASSKQDEAQALKQAIGNSGCKTGGAAATDCKTAHDTAQSVDARRDISTAGFVVAGAALVGTAVYWFWPRSQTERTAQKSNFMVMGAPTAHGGSMLVSGSF